MKLSRTNELNARKASIACAFAALAFSVSAGAEEQEMPYTMSAVINASYGHKVTAGDYEQAIERLTAPEYHLRDSFEARTNLCVAYTKTGAIAEAAESCEAAVKELERDRFNRRSRSDMALALSNRGVLRAVQGEIELAREDFRAAVDLKSGIDAPSINLARLDSDMYADTYSAE